MSNQKNQKLIDDTFQVMTVNKDGKVFERGKSNQLR